MAAAEELTRKKELVAQRKKHLEEGQADKAGENMDNRDSVGSLEGDKTKTDPKYGKQNSLLNPQIQHSAPQKNKKRAFSHAVDTNNKNKLVKQLKDQQLHGVKEGGSESEHSFLSSPRENTATARMKANENQLTKLSNNVLSHYDNAVGSIMKPTQYEPQVSEFDKLRKRVNYLTKGKHTPLNAAQEQVPWNMQIYQGFLEEDERKRKAMRESRILNEGRASDNNESDSDESIREIKRKQKRTQVKIDLNNLSDAQINRLNMKQIDNLSMDPPILTMIDPDDHEKALN